MPFGAFCLGVGTIPNPACTSCTIQKGTEVASTHSPQALVPMEMNQTIYFFPDSAHLWKACCTWSTEPGTKGTHKKESLWCRSLKPRGEHRQIRVSIHRSTSDRWDGARGLGSQTDPSSDPSSTLGVEHQLGTTPLCLSFLTAIRG